MKIRAKKNLGQHFLTNKETAQKIAEAFPIDSNDTVLEVGPGMGMLTQFLIPQTNKLHLIEIDDEAVNYLHKSFPDLIPNIKHADFLKFDISSEFPDGIVLIGNFPYNISAPILFHALHHRAVIKGVTGMFQKEVAERIAAPHGSRTYGILSVLIQTFFRTELLFTVGPEQFSPPPKIDSAVLRLTKIENKQLKCDDAFFIKVVKTSFGMRRKMLRNSLKPMPGAAKLEHPFMTMRPEQLSPAQFEELALLIKQKL